MTRVTIPEQPSRDLDRPTLCRHLNSRADLLVQVVDRVFGEIDVDPGRAAAWPDACGVLATAMLEVLRRRRHAAPLVGARVPVGTPSALRCN